MADDNTTYIFDVTVRAKVRMGGTSREDARERAVDLLAPWLESGFYSVDKVTLKNSVTTVRTLDDVETRVETKAS